MKNKVLVKIIIPEIGCEFDLFIPVNELVWKVKKLIIKAVNDLTGESLDGGREYILLNKASSTIYPNNKTVIETDIRNASELIILSEKG